MKQTLLIFTIIVLIFGGYNSTEAKPMNSTEKNLSALSNRLNAFESYWNRFQIGGNLTVKSSTFYNQQKENMESLNFNQQMDIFFNSVIDKNMGVSIRLSQNGGWGQNYQSVSSNSNPMTTPLIIDEAFLRWENPYSINYFGRFKFSLSPLGLISDFSTNPVEGITIQKSFNNFHAIALYSRVNTEYLPGTELIAASEDYWAARFGWSDRHNIIGINLVPNGITGEKNISIDWSHDWSGQKFTIETAWYSFNSAKYPLYKVNWIPGVLLSYGKVFGEENYLQLKAGYFSNQFMPSYSSLAHSSGDNREWFLPNTQGIEVFLKNQLKPSWFWENRAFIFNPIDTYPDSNSGYRLLSSVIKLFSPVNQLQLGLDLKNTKLVNSNRVFITWTLRF